MINKILEQIGDCKSKYSFFIKNLKTGETFKFNENAVISSASTIKVLIMAEVMNQVKQGRLSLSQRIIVGEDEKVPFSILTLLEAGNSYSLKDVVTLMIIQSDNTATNLLIDLAGMENINKFAKTLGLKKTILQRKMMDFNARNEGRDNFTTAEDMAHILNLMYNGEIIDKEFDSLMLDIMKNQLDKTMLHLHIPDDVEIAHKSGELDNLDHEVAIFYTGNLDYIFVMLTWDAESNNYARKLVAETAKITYDILTNSETK